MTTAVHSRAVLAVLFTFAAGLALGATGSAKRPNVIVILTDDQGYGDLSCHGNPVLKTPNLDRLHDQSIRLTDFHVAPMCTPTRGELLCGIDALANGAMNVSSGRTLLRPELRTMADMFAAGGYRTGIFGKWHLGDNYPYRPQDRGFHESVWFPSSHIGSAPDAWNNDYFGDRYRHGSTLRRHEGYCTDVFFDEAIGWIREQHEKEQPFFAYIPLNAAHWPWFVPDKYREPYRDLPKDLCSFFAMLANIDENVGRLDAMLTETGLSENTILVFLSDNGGTVGVPFYNAGMRGRKVTLWEGGHRVPCFFRWPAGGLRPAGDVTELTHVQDLLPTLRDLCGLEPLPQQRCDGVSLAPLLRGQAGQTKKLADRMLVVQFSRMNGPRPKRGDAAVLWRHWRLLRNKELYDLRADPAQKHNVIQDHPDVVRRMRAHYAKWWAGVSGGLDTFQAVPIGSEHENPTMLSACEWADVFVDQGVQIRRGVRKNGRWHLTVDRPGEYQLALRRWPSEVHVPLTAGVPAHQGEDGEYAAGVALPIAKARFKIGPHDLSRAVTGKDEQIVFTVRLDQGPVQLQTWFLDAEEKPICGAYYVIATRVGE